LHRDPVGVRIHPHVRAVERRPVVVELRWLPRRRTPALWRAEAPQVAGLGVDDHRRLEDGLPFAEERVLVAVGRITDGMTARPTPRAWRFRNRSFGRTWMSPRLLREQYSVVAFGLLGSSPGRSACPSPTRCDRHDAELDTEVGSFVNPIAPCNEGVTMFSTRRVLLVPNTSIR